jgi:hypothetical protein
VERSVEEERDDRPDEDGQGALHVAALAHVRRWVEPLELRQAVGRNHELAAEDEIEQAADEQQRHDRDGGEVDDEVVERELWYGRPDHDVRRVADQRRGPPDVGGDHLDEHERDRRDAQHVGEQERDRDDEEDRREVVEEGRGRACDARQQEHEPERSPLRELRRAQRQVGEDAGSLGEPDEDHHPGEEPERAPIHGLDRPVEVDDPDHDDQPGPHEGGLRAVHPLEGDHPERGEEHDDGDDVQRGSAGISSRSRRGASRPQRQ